MTQFAELARQVAADGTITAEELLSLRRAGWASGDISADEADAIFAINAALNQRDAAWTDFFVEAIGEYVLNGTEPKGYVSEHSAAWLLNHVEQDSALCSMTELELLLRVLERSLNGPETLKQAILLHVKHAVLNGTGPTRSGDALTPGRVTAAEAQILRRAIFAAGGDGPASVSRAEADLLFTLKDATLGADNAPEWQRLFVQGVANHLQGMVGPNAQISRERAAELNDFVNAETGGVNQFLRKMVRAVPQTLEVRPNALGVVFGKKAVPDRMAQLAQAEHVTADEQAWLDDKISADGQLDPFEQALLRFLQEE